MAATRRPGQRRGPWLIVWQVRWGTARQQELDHVWKIEARGPRQRRRSILVIARRANQFTPRHGAEPIGSLSGVNSWDGFGTVVSPNESSRVPTGPRFLRNVPCSLLQSTAGSA